MPLKIETQPIQFNDAVSVLNSVSAVSYYGDGSDLTGIYQGTDLQNLSGNWQDTYTTVTNNSASWVGGNDAYNISTVYANNSASYATADFVNSNFLNLTGGIVTGEMHFNGDVTVFGSLTATGTTTFANTLFSVTSALSVVHTGAGPAMFIGNDGTGDIASFYDIDQNVEILHVGGINSQYPNVGVKTSIPNKTFTVVGEISSTSDITTSGKVYLQEDGNSDQWNSTFKNVTTLSGSWQDAYTSWSNASATSVVAFSDTRFSKLSSCAYTFDSGVSSIDAVNGVNIATGVFSGVLGGNCNTTSGNYSTVVGGFSSCATGYATFVGAGSGNRSTGDYTIVAGGRNNTASGCYNTVGGGRLNCAFGAAGAAGTDNTIAGGCFNRVFAKCQTISGGAQNCIGAGGAQSTISGGYQNNINGSQSTIAGGIRNNISNTGSFIGGSNNTINSQFSNINGGCCNTVSGNNSNINGGFCNVVTGMFSVIGGGLGNYNPLRDSIIDGGVANHTGGFAPFNITSTASISGNGSQTRLTGTGIQSCFSFPFTTNNVSVYYSTPSIPLSAGCFITATVAATGSNFIVINGDYSTCTPSGLSANNIFVYDRAINNTGYGNVINGGKLNTASGCYNIVVGGFNNQIMCQTLAQSCGNLIVGGFCNCICTTQFANTLVGGQLNVLGGAQRGFIGGGIGNRICGFGNQNTIVAGGGNTASGSYGAMVAPSNSCITGNYSFAGGGCGNCACANYSGIMEGRGNTITASGAYSAIVSGRFNYNPLFNSNIEGGSFNHTGGFTPNNLTTTAISGNGSQTALIAAGIGSRFSASNTTGAVSLVWMTSGTANASLSSACFAIANVVTNAANCIIINGDYSTRTVSGLSACSVYVFDRCLNNNGCSNFIGGGTLNTASGNYSFIGGGTCNLVTGNGSIVVGGTLNTASGSCAIAVGGCCNTASGNYSSVLGGSSNSAAASWGAVVGGLGNRVGGYGFVGSGYNNCACGNSGNSMSVITGGRDNLTTGSCSGYSAIGGGCGNLICANGDRGVIAGGGQNCVTNFYGAVVGGRRNTASGAYSFVAGGSANDTRGFANTFILGSSLSASKANYTYVNNLSVQGNIESNTNYVATLSLTANQTANNASDTVITLDPLRDPNNWFNRSTRRFTPTIPGYYHVDYQVAWGSGTAGSGNQNNIQIRRNTTSVALAQQPINSSNVNTTQNTTNIAYLNGTTDYLEFTAYSSNTAQGIIGTSDGAWTKVEVFKIN